MDRELRKELTAYLCRLVIRPEIAEEIAQSAELRLLEAGARAPATEGTRAWLFKVATNLALDELRRHRNWRETAVQDLREAAEADPDFVARSTELIGTPETKAIAREHLTACFACTLRNLPEHKAAALLLAEVHGFSVKEIAKLLESTEAQVKNWLQDARAHMEASYARTCALIAKSGVCYQCVELDGFFRADAGNPLAAGANHIDARLGVLRQLRDRPWQPWHRLLFRLLDDIG